MKKLIICFILTLLLTLPSAINSYIIVSGSTFTMPSVNNSKQEDYNNKDTEYHKYNIENKNNETINRYNMYNSNITNEEDNIANNKNHSVSNGSSTYNIKQNIQSKNTPVPSSTPDNNITNNKNNTDKSKTNKKIGKNKIKNKIINNKKIDNNNPDGNNTTNNNIINKKTDKNKDASNITPDNNINNSTIEFSKHFIKIPAGSTTNIPLKIKPKNLSSKNIIYKSDNNLVATYKNNKITGIKKGFTTILIELPDGTIKAACPVKVV